MVDKKREASSGPEHTKRIFDKLEAFKATESDCRSGMSQEQQDEWDSYIEKKMSDQSETKEKQYQQKKQLIDLAAETQRVPFAAEMRTGYDKTPYVRGKVQIGKLQKQHVDAMRAEFDECRWEYTDKDGIKNLSKLLKQKLGGEPKFFKPVTDIDSWDYEVIQ
jgi:hypothetical protein